MANVTTGAQWAKTAVVKKTDRNAMDNLVFYIFN